MLNKSRPGTHTKPYTKEFKHVVTGLLALKKAWFHAWRSSWHLNCLKCGQELCLHISFPGFWIISHSYTSRQSEMTRGLGVTGWHHPYVSFCHDPINQKHNTEICVIKGILHTSYKKRRRYVLSDVGANVLAVAVSLLWEACGWEPCWSHAAIAVTVMFKREHFWQI